MFMHHLNPWAKYILVDDVGIVLPRVISVILDLTCGVLHFSCFFTLCGIMS